MNAIAFLVITTAIGQDSGWVNTRDGTPQLVAQVNGNFNQFNGNNFNQRNGNPNALGGTYAGPGMPAYSHADAYTNQQPIDDLPDRPRIDTIPFADRSQLGWNTQRTGFDATNGNRSAPAGFQQGFPNNPANQGFNAPNNTGFNAPNNNGFNAANPGFNAPNNMGFNGNGNVTNVPPLTPVNPAGQPGYGQNQFGGNNPGFQNNQGFQTPPNSQPNFAGNGNGWSNPSNNGFPNPPPTTRYNDPNSDHNHGSRANNFGANGNGNANPNGFGNTQPGGPNSFGNPGFNGQNAYPGYNGQQRPAPYGNSPNGFSEPGLGSNPNNFGREEPYTSNAQNALFPPTNGDFNRSRSSLPTASISRNSVQQGFSSTFASLLLFASLGGNIYLGWLARDFYWRYRDMAWEMRGHNTSSN